MASTLEAPPIAQPEAQPSSKIQAFQGTVIERKGEGNKSKLEARSNALKDVFEQGVLPDDVKTLLSNPDFISDLEQKQSSRRLVPAELLTDERKTKIQEMLGKITSDNENPLKKLYSQNEKLSDDELLSLKIIGAGLLQEYPPTKEAWDQGDDKFKANARLAQAIVRGTEMRFLEAKLQDGSLPKDVAGQHMKRMAQWLENDDLPDIVANKMAKVGAELGQAGVKVETRLDVTQQYAGMGTKVDVGKQYEGASTRVDVGKQYEGASTQVDLGKRYSEKAAELENKKIKEAEKGADAGEKIIELSAWKEYEEGVIWKDGKGGRVEDYMGRRAKLDQEIDGLRAKAQPTNAERQILASRLKQKEWLMGTAKPPRWTKDLAAFPDTDEGRKQKAEYYDKAFRDADVKALSHAKKAEGYNTESLRFKEAAELAAQGGAPEKVKQVNDAVERRKQETLQRNKETERQVLEARLAQEESQILQDDVGVEAKAISLIENNSHSAEVDSIVGFVEGVRFPDPAHQDQFSRYMKIWMADMQNAARLRTPADVVTDRNRRDAAMKGGWLGRMGRLIKSWWKTNSQGVRFEQTSPDALREMRNQAIRAFEAGFATDADYQISLKHGRQSEQYNISANKFYKLIASRLRRINTLEDLSKLNQ